MQANTAFDTYRELYFEGGVSSVYLWDMDDGFAGVVLIKKGAPPLTGRCGRNAVVLRYLVVFQSYCCTPWSLLLRGHCYLMVVGDGSKKIKGCWDSIHVFEAQEKSSGKNAHYQLTSTVMLWLEVCGPCSVS